MTYRVDIDNTGRDFFFTPSGDDALSGHSIQNSVTTPNKAIELVNALIPAPTASNGASINAVVSGTFFSGIITPDFTTINCEFASMITSDVVAIDIGNGQSVRWGALLNFADNGVNCMIDGKQRVSAEINAMVVGNDGAFGAETFDNIGVKIQGVSQDIFIEIRQLALNGERAIGLDHTAVTTTPIIYKIEKAEFFNVDQTLVRLEDGATERIEVEVTSVKRAVAATQPTTNSIIFDTVSGQLNVQAQSLDADIVGRVGDGAQLGLISNTCTGDLQILEGGECFFNSGVLVGDITVAVGGRLEVIINVHAGTITNNGTLNGIINGVPYGSWIQKHEEQVVLNASSFIDQNPLALDTPLQITFGAAQFTASDPVSLSAAGAVTINQSDQYNLDMIVQYGRLGAGQFSLLFFRILVNGVQFGNSRYAKLDNANADIPIQFSAPMDLTQGDVVTIELVRDSAGNNSGGILTATPVLAWSPAPSASLGITRNRLVQPV